MSASARLTSYARQSVYGGLPMVTDGLFRLDAALSLMNEESFSVHQHVAAPEPLSLAETCAGVEEHGEEGSPVGRAARLDSTLPAPRSTRYSARDQMIAGPGTRNAAVCPGALLRIGDLATRHATRRRQ